MKFYGICRLPGENDKRESIGIVLEQMEGSLDVLLAEERTFSTEQQANILIDIARGMQHMHQNGIVHRDISAKNILVCFDWFIINSKYSNGVFKIGDLGSSTSKNDITGTITGTVGFQAPEMLNPSQRRYNFEVDIFSFGSVMWQVNYRYVLILQVLHPSQDLITRFKIDLHLTETDDLVVKIPNAMKSGFRPKFDQSIPSYLQELAKDCWHQNYAQRPSWEEILLRLEGKDVTVRKL